MKGPFEDFDGKAEDIRQHISRFTQRCDETGVVEDFSFIISENLPPSDVDPVHSKRKDCMAFSDPRHFNQGNFHINASQATIEKVQAARHKIRASIKQFASPPDPKTMLLASKQ
jgi:hypothetical protein